MRILTSETKDQTRRTFLEISKDKLILSLEKDNGWHEVINMFDSSKEVRLYFDIDSYKNKDAALVKLETLTALNKRFSTTDDDWAICFSPSTEKVSYHILSKKYKCSLSSLRIIAEELKLDWIDKSVYWYDRNEQVDQGYFRLPNQSKTSINKIGLPLIIQQGSISDFLVTDIENLISLPVIANV